MTCPLTQEEYGEDSLMWYVDDPRPLTDRRNWTPEKMNELLERETLYSKCCRPIFYFVFRIKIIFAFGHFARTLQ